MENLGPLLHKVEEMDARMAKLEGLAEQVMKGTAAPAASPATTPAQGPIKEGEQPSQSQIFNLLHAGVFGPGAAGGASETDMERFKTFQGKMYDMQIGIMDYVTRKALRDKELLPDPPERHIVKHAGGD